MLVLTRVLSKRRVYRRPTTLEIFQVRWTRRLFKRKYLALNVLANALLLATGDIVVQEIEISRALASYPKKRYDWARTARMIALGGVQEMPLYIFYSRLENYLPGRDIRSITTKTILDQLIAAPLSITIFFLGVGILEGKNFVEQCRELKKKFWRVYSVDCLIWPAAQAINFKYVPASHRMLFISVVTIIFNVFLSYAHYNMPEVPNLAKEEDPLKLSSVPVKTNGD